MRIGMILDASFPPDVRVENEALSLARAGHQIFLFSLDFDGRTGPEKYKDIDVVRYPAGRALYKLSALAYTVPFYRWIVSGYIRDFIKSFGIQILHIHDMVIAEGAMQANRSFRLPVVLDLHENRPEIMKEYKHAQSPMGKAMISLKRWSEKYYELAARADRVVVVTEAAGGDIIEKTGKNSKNVVVVPNTVKIGDFTSHPVNKEIVRRMDGFYNIVYIGDTSIRRGTDTAIRAMALIKDNIPNARLWLVGKSSADRELKALCGSIGVTESVVMEGWQLPEFLPSYLTGASIALSPLKKNRHHDTTYANKLFQYMILGIPVVVSDSRAQADLVELENCGLVHQADDPKSLAEKILFLHGHGDVASAMGERGKKAVFSKWNWDETVKHLINLYDRNF